MPVDTGAEEHQQAVLTPEEREYVEQRGVLRVGADPNWPPFSLFDDQGNFTGIDHELLLLIQQHTGVQYEFVQTTSWEETYEMALNGELDIICAFSKNEEREKFFAFTEPYLSYPLAIITRTEHPLIIDIWFSQELKFVLPDGHVTTEQLIRDMPDLNVVKVPSSRESLRQVSRRNADATLENLVSAKAIIRENGLTNLKIGGISAYRFELHFAVDREDEMLLSIMNKGLASISEQERFAILNRWIEVDHEPLIIWENVWKAGLIIGLLVTGIIIFITYWNRTLSTEIERRYQAERQLIQAGKEKDFVMTMVAHDLGNPVTALQMQLELMDDLDGGRVEKMQDLVSRIGRLIRQLVLLQSVERKSPNIDEVDVDVNELVGEVVKMHQTRAAQKQIKLNFTPSTEGDLSEWMTNQDAVIQIIENLISNAIKYSPQHKEVFINVSTASDVVEIKVKDQGPGISPEDQKKLFKEPVAQINRPTAGEASSGLGLWIVNGLVKRLGGQIGCSSPPEGGTEFTVTFKS